MTNGDPTTLSSQPPAPRRPPRARWLLLFRKWHGWVGLVMSLAIIVVCGTGILLNHKDALHLDDEGGEGAWTSLPQPGATEADAGVSVPLQSNVRPPGRLTTGLSENQLPVALGAALNAARQVWGDVSLEKIELKTERGELGWKMTARDKRQLFVSLETGRVLAKAWQPRRSSVTQRASEQRSRLRIAGLPVGKFIKELHTGKLGGVMGKLFMDATSLVILLLTMTGLYLWLAPKMRTRRPI